MIRLVVVEIDCFTNVCGECSYNYGNHCSLFNFPLETAPQSDNQRRLSQCKDAEWRAKGVE